ncbi:MAG: DNA repair protein RadA [Patescibacteria group bacterium]|jgi:DNA repair protein RadA/Sms
MSASSIFVCQQCGKTSAKWQGRCDSCGAFGSLVEEVVIKSTTKLRASRSANPVELSQISRQNWHRMTCGNADVDKVLGGGIVPGSIVLLGGEPGIGKSTLLLQIADKIPNALYITGEESLEQVSDRADRLKIKSNFKLLQETDINIIAATIENEKPALVIIDSIQTVINSDIPGVAGSIVQVRGGAQLFQQLAKKLNIPIVLVGHVTKEGTIAGPRTLEHIVDVVLSFEGDAFQQSRILRGLKNRFGATNEVAILSMSENGLTTVDNPSELFLSNHLDNVPGSVVTSILEGRRPLLVEVQALTVPTGFGYPKRTAVGIDLNRLNILVAVLQRRASLKLESSDVYVNVVGGIKIQDPAGDLAICVAIASSLLNISIPKSMLIIGEVGLLGEIRPVSKLTDREKEAKRLGYSSTISEKTIKAVISKLFQK